MKCAIAILNWNGHDDTIACLQSLLPHLTGHDFLFVLDNGSEFSDIQRISEYLHDSGLKYIESESGKLKENFEPEVHLYFLKNGKNLGFGGGNNVLLKQLEDLPEKFELVWLLNNDALVDNSSLTELKKAFVGDPRTAAAGSLILNFPDHHTIQCTAVKHYKWLGVSKLINKNLNITAFDEQAIIQFDYLNGASIMFRLESLAKAGFFDERFFLYSEEFDLQLTLKEMGYMVQFVYQSRVRHKLSGGTSKGRHFFYFHYNRSTMLLSKKHFGPLVTFVSSWCLLGITFVRTFPNFKNFFWGVKGQLSGLAGK